MKNTIWLLIVMMTFAACKGRKQTANRNIDQAFKNAFFENETTYNHVSLKGKLNVSSKDFSQSASINVRMIKDSVLWMSLGMLGFEGARVLITKDSFKMIDRINSRYIARSSSYIRSLIGFDVQLIEIQNLMMGNAVFDSSKYEIKSNDSLSWLQGNKDEIVNQLTVSEEFHTIQSVLISMVRSQKAVIDYKDYADLGGLIMPKTVDAAFISGIEKSTGEISYTSADTSKISGFPFNVPDSFKKN
ncbi:DUF4292 domain-containing protein [bacterium]|nr:DUF4292 domain-containing protein [bacterium]